MAPLRGHRARRITADRCSPGSAGAGNLCGAVFGARAGDPWSLVLRWYSIVATRKACLRFGRRRWATRVAAASINAGRCCLEPQRANRGWCFSRWLSRSRPRTECTSTSRSRISMRKRFGWRHSARGECPRRWLVQETPHGLLWQTLRGMSFASSTTPTRTLGADADGPRTRTADRRSLAVSRLGIMRASCLRVSTTRPRRIDRSA